MEDLSKDELLTLLYYDLEKGYGSTQSLFKQAKDENPIITLEYVKQWMAKQPNKQRQPYRGSGNSYVANFPRDQFQMDLGDMVELQLHPTQKRYILVCVDIFSKYGMAVIVNDRSASEAYKAITHIFSTMGIPRSVYTDDGAEFKGKVNDLFHGEGAKHIITSTHPVFVERLIRTIKQGLHDRVRFNNAKWEDMLPFVINKYNNTEHSATGFKPSQAINDKYAGDIKVKLELQARHKRRYPTISEQDHVKIRIKQRHNKESKSKWSDETYTVEKITKEMDTYYHLDGKQRAYLRHELLLITD
jgi:hypothetical protein